MITNGTPDVILSDIMFSNLSKPLVYYLCKMHKYLALYSLQNQNFHLLTLLKHVNLPSATVNQHHLQNIYHKSMFSRIVIQPRKQANKHNNIQDKLAHSYQNKS